MLDQARATSERPLVGRADDAERLIGLLVGESVRLITLVGPGGVGKTRLALAVAESVRDQFADGVSIVDLAPVREASLLLTALATALSVQPATDLASAVADAVGSRHMLLLLDNFEQVASAAPALSDLLAACPALSLLVTSREPLALAWEQLYQVRPLECPSAESTDWQEVGRAPAVALFVQQARAVRPRFALGADNAAAVAEICRRLDGLPLAIELAAARTRLLSAEAILVQLRQRPLALLTGGPRDAPERHRTLREAIAWSYGLLEPSQQTLFRELAVCVGGCTFEALEAIHTGPDVAVSLESLLDKHLLAVDDGSDGEVRYRQLETIREFGAEQLESSGEAASAWARQASFLVGLVTDLAPDLYGPSQRAASQRLLAEHNNIRAVLDWSATSREPASVELGLKLAGALWLFWRLRGFVGEGRVRLDRLLAAADVRVTSAGVDWSHAQLSVSLARALHAAGYLAFAQAAADDAQRRLFASLEVARQVGDAWSQSYALHGLGHAALMQGDFSEARARYAERLAIAQKQRDDYALAQVLNALGEVARCLDEPRVARDYYERSLELRCGLGDTRGVAMGLINLGHVHVAEGDLSSARQALLESFRLLEDLEHQYGQAVCVAGLAALAAAEGESVTAARRLGATSAALERVGNSLEPADRVAYDRTLASVRRALTARFECEFAFGRELPLAEAARAGSPTVAPQPPRLETTSSEVASLSAREREVVALIARGYTSEAIAEALVITRRTADTHAAHIRDKLGLRSRAEIAAWAIRHGLA